MIKLILVHLWTKEISAHDIDVVTAAFVSFRWGQSGYYDLDLKHNTIKAREKKVRLRGKPVLWKAADIDAIREAVKLHLAAVSATHAEHKAPLDVTSAMQRHAATMPKGQGDGR